MNVHDEGDAWASVSSGLRLYRSGVVASLVLTCIAVGTVGLALLSRNPSYLQGMALVLPLASLAATLMMLVGLVRYASNLPSRVDATPSAVGAIILMILGALLQLYAYSIVWRLHSLERRARGGSDMWDLPDLGTLMEKAKMLPWLELVTTVAGLIGLLMMLGSLRALARSLSDRSLAERATGLSVAIGLLAVFTAGIRWYLATARRPSAGLMIVLGLAALIWALVTVIQYIGLLRETADTIEARPPEIPLARVR